MKIAYCSDLHLEFGDLVLKNGGGADVLVLAGDVLVAEDLHRHEAVTSPYAPPSKRWVNAQRYRDFIRRVSSEFPEVVVIAGNHEFYDGHWPGHINVLVDEYSRYPNVRFLEHTSVQLGDVVFLGGTLWTDMNRGNPVTMQAAADGMNDFSVIRNDLKGYKKLRPQDLVQNHKRLLSYFKAVIDNYPPTSKFVVVSHHAPTSGSVHPNYLTGPYSAVNGAYYSDLSEFILDRPQIRLWVHGHTHHSWDYLVGTTRVVCNPRGYHGYEDRADNFKLEYVNV